MFIDQLGRAIEGAATDKDLSARMLGDLCSKAKDLSSAATREKEKQGSAQVQKLAAGTKSKGEAN